MRAMCLIKFFDCVRLDFHLASWSSQTKEIMEFINASPGQVGLLKQDILKASNTYRIAVNVQIFNNLLFNTKQIPISESMFAKFVLFTSQNNTKNRLFV